LAIFLFPFLKKRVKMDEEMLRSTFKNAMGRAPASEAEFAGFVDDFTRAVFHERPFCPHGNSPLKDETVISRVDGGFTVELAKRGDCSCTDKEWSLLQGACGYYESKLPF
jgi:hypothetical protein